MPRLAASRIAPRLRCLVALAKYLRRNSRHFSRLNHLYSSVLGPTSFSHPNATTPSSLLKARAGQTDSAISSNRSLPFTNSLEFDHSEDSPKTSSGHATLSPHAFPLLGPIRFAGCSSGGTGWDLLKLNVRRRPLHFRERFAPWPPRRSPIPAAMELPDHLFILVSTLTWI